MSKPKANSNASKNSQFKKGLSGNLKGRPKGSAKSHNLEDPLAALSTQTYQGYKNGKPRELSSKEVLQTKVYKKAFEGNLKAIREVLRWIKMRAAFFEASRKGTKAQAPKLELETTDPKNVDKALQILGIIGTENPAKTVEIDDRTDTIGSENHCQHWLQPWIVQAALSRHRGSKLMSGEDLNWALAYTCNATTVKIPRSYKNDR